MSSRRSAWARQEQRTACDNCGSPFAEHVVVVPGAGAVKSCQRCWPGLQLVLMDVVEAAPGSRVEFCPCGEC